MSMSMSNVKKPTQYWISKLSKLRWMGLRDLELVTRAPLLIGQRKRGSGCLPNYQRRVAVDLGMCGNQVFSHRDVGPTCVSPFSSVRQRPIWVVGGGWWAVAGGCGGNFTNPDHHLGEISDLPWGVGWWGGVPTPLLFIMAQTRVDNLRLKIRAKSDSTYGSFWATCHFRQEQIQKRRWGTMTEAFLILGPVYSSVPEKNGNLFRVCEFFLFNFSFSNGNEFLIIFLWYFIK